MVKSDPVHGKKYTYTQTYTHITYRFNYTLMFIVHAMR